MTSAAEQRVQTRLQGQTELTRSTAARQALGASWSLTGFRNAGAVIRVQGIGSEETRGRG